jgi:type II secretory pathway component GspD/PulD (secretin)
MRKWTKTAGVLFMAASAVYSGQVAVAASAKSANAGAGAKPSAKPAAPAAPIAAATEAPAADATATNTTEGATAPATQPTTAPSADAAADPFAAPATAAGGEGQSVTAPEVNVSDAGTVEIHVNDANLVEVLRMLSLQAQKNIVASKDVRGTVTANLYDVTVREALDAILKANGYGYREKGNFIYVYTAKEVADIEKQERQPVTEVFRLHYTPAANAVTMIKPVLSPEAQVSFTTPAKGGIESGIKDLGGDSHATEDIIVVSDFPDRMEAVRRILREVDRRPQQVLIEAVIMRATLKEDNELGIDFTAVGGIDFNNLVGLGDTGGSSGGGTGSGGSSGGSSAGGLTRRPTARTPR